MKPSYPKLDQEYQQYNIEQEVISSVLLGKEEPSGQAGETETSAITRPLVDNPEGRMGMYGTLQIVSPSFFLELCSGVID